VTASPATGLVRDRSEARGAASTHDEAFRDELRAWLREHPPPAVQLARTPDEAEALRDWHRTLRAGGWIGLHWPVEFGGRGASPTQIAIYNEELARACAPPLLARGGLSIVGPTLMAHGTEEQQHRWLPRILAGDDVWCQLFSEPGAGSDLAGLTTRAERRGATYVVNGQKVWSSYARFANWGIALVRTDPSAPKNRGISMLAIPMDAAGIDVRPLRQINGESEFSEVFFDDVEIPAANLIGPEHAGWHVANTTLANERGASFVWKEQVLHELAVKQLIDECTRARRHGDPQLRQRLARSVIEIEIFRLHNARTRARLARGEELGAESSLVKLFWANMSQRLYDTAIAALGPAVLLMPDDADAIDGGRWTLGFLTSRATSIMGGTSEIQRNIIGERLLGLPREPTPRVRNDHHGDGEHT
jgi:alkylation response protein AidB-like acyl-CoA dehydrogenase